MLNKLANNSKDLDDNDNEEANNAKYEKSLHWKSVDIVGSLTQ